MPFHNLFTPVVIMKAIEKGPDYASWWFACVWPQMSSSIGGVSLVYYYVVVHSKAAVKHIGEFSNFKSSNTVRRLQNLEKSHALLKNYLVT